MRLLPASQFNTCAYFYYAITATRNAMHIVSILSRYLEQNFPFTLEIA